jgi:hypothetical protein
MTEQFEKFWAELEPGFAEIQPIMVTAFKELAHTAWAAGYDDGWHDCFKAYGLDISI